MGDGWSLSIEADRPAGSLPQLKTVEARTQVVAMAERRRFQRLERMKRQVLALT